LTKLTLIFSRTFLFLETFSQHPIRSDAPNVHSVLNDSISLRINCLDFLTLSSKSSVAVEPIYFQRLNRIERVTRDVCIFSARRRKSHGETAERERELDAEAGKCV